MRGEGEPLEAEPGILAPIPDFASASHGAPTRSDTSPVEARLRRSFRLLHLVGPLFGLIIPALLLRADSTPDGVVPVLTAGICLFWLFPLLMRLTPRLDEPALGSVQLLVFLSLFGCYHYGGLASPFAVWLIVAVLLSFLYAPRLLAWCIAGGAIQIAMYLALYETAPPPPSRLTDGQMGLISAASVLAATLYISLIAAFYARIKTEGSALAETSRQQQAAALKLRAAVREAEAENEAISKFMAGISHELRTSLNVVIGYGEMLAEDAAMAEQVDGERLLRRVTHASRDLLAMVDEVAVSAEPPHPPASSLSTAPSEREQNAARPARQRLALPALDLSGLLKRIRAPRPAAYGRVERDELTGLNNRTAFQTELEQGLATHSGQKVALLAADLNGFKEVNDSLGHDVGDLLLRAVAARFAGITPERILTARLGGDEFGAAAFGEDAEAVILGLAEAMTEALTAPIQHGEDYLTIGVSIGIAQGMAGSIGGRELLRRGDVALNRAKDDKRDPIRTFEPQMDEALRFRRTIRQDLEAAIAGDQFDLMLQPVVDARGGQLVSAEALLRWPHPVLGFVSPAKLIPLAEESGQIVAIDDWVLDRALAYAARLQALPIAVNISPVQFRHAGFARKIVDQLAAQGVEPRLLRLEITEGVLVSHTRAAQRAIGELREAGIKIALDDFGTGFSSLSYLKDLPFDYLKIDRSFVTEIDRGRQGAELLRAIIDLGHSLGMGVIAEGVETPAQASLIQLLGCDFIQGYFTGRPASIDAIEARLRGGAEPSIHRAATA